MRTRRNVDDDNDGGGGACRIDGPASTPLEVRNACQRRDSRTRARDSTDEAVDQEIDRRRRQTKR